MSIGSVLSCSPHIVENIFRNLTAKELCNCASVCHLWAIVSQEEIQRRREIVPFFQGIKCGKHRRVHKNHKNCSMRQAGRFENELKEKLENVSIKPSFCIAFATTGFLEYFEQLFPNYFASSRPRKRFKRCHLDYFDTAVKIALQKYLPPACSISLFVESDIMFCDGDSQSLVETNAPAICGYLFSNFPGGELNFYKRKEHTGMILRHIIRNGPNIKGSLNLIEYASIPYFQIALNELRRRHDAFESGIIMPVRRASSFVPVFEGPKVQVFRFAIGYNVLIRENGLETTMSQWKNTMEQSKALSDRTIAFIFSIDFVYYYASCGLFKTFFPSIPLIGLFRCTWDVEDEDLTNYIDYEADKSAMKSGLKYSCVFLLVTFED